MKQTKKESGGNYSFPPSQTKKQAPPFINQNRCRSKNVSKPRDHILLDNDDEYSESYHNSYISDDDSEENDRKSNLKKTKIQILKLFHINGKLYFISQTNNQIEVYQSSSIHEKFTLLDFSSQKPPFKNGTSIFKLNDTIFLFGGINQDMKIELWKINLNQSMLCSWENVRLIGKINKCLYHHKSVVINDHHRKIVYSFGGFCGTKFSEKLFITLIGPNFCINQEVSFNTVTNEQNLVQFYPLGRYFHSFTKVNKNIYLFGGINSDFSCLNDLWELNYILFGAMRPVWQKIDFLFGPCPRHSHLAYSFNDSLFIVGGIDNENHVLNDIWYFKDNKWKLIGSFEMNENLPFKTNEKNEMLSHIYDYLNTIEYNDSSNKLFGYKGEIYSFEFENKIFEKMKMSSPESINDELYEKLVKKRSHFLDQENYNLPKILKTNSNLCQHNKKMILDSFIDGINNSLQNIQNNYLKFNQNNINKSCFTIYSNELQLKLNHMKNKYETLNRIKELNQKNYSCPIEKSKSITLIPTSYTSLENCLKGKDTNSIKHLNLYYSILQNLKFEENIEIMKNYKTKISEKQAKYSSYNEKISNLIKEISTISQLSLNHDKQVKLYQKRISFLSKMDLDINTLEDERINKISFIQNSITNIKNNFEQITQKKKKIEEYNNLLLT
ncbi:hypothetical protein TRFO_28027 [Tritrichomonas foetus]|uniref:Kelch motif family protein n=1 Tax=Tritrichomonas foetus TaxID=1144522 RepID=A0A1J4JZC6_9EUKA|nr:hypothetical protein TRFO_28027 [Tritrichomonas foetus]|eukprot:OHT04513.1 hypothetical protein TRFO_28027 [Tritrichomonas foetus]